MSRYRVETTTVAAASIDAVWDRVADASTWSEWGQWDETTLDREGVPAPDGVGAIRRFRGRQTTVEEVVAFEPPADGHARFAYELHSGLPLRDYHSEVTLETVGGGRASVGCRRSTARTRSSVRSCGMALARFIPDTARRLAARRRSRPVIPSERPARRHPGRRPHPRAGGPDVRAPAHRSGGGGDRGAEPRGRWRVLVARFRRRQPAPQQARHRRRPHHRRRSRRVLPARRTGRRRGRELPARREVPPRHRSRRGVGGEPARRLRVDLRVRPDRPVRVATGRRPDRAGPRRPDERHRPARAPGRGGSASPSPTPPPARCLTQGVLAALLARDRTGRGQWVHTSLLEAMVSFMDFQATRWLIDGVVPGPGGQPAPDHGADGCISRPPTATSTSPRMGDFARLLRAGRRARARRRPALRRRSRRASTHRAELDADLARALAHTHHRRVGRASRRRRARAARCSRSTRCSPIRRSSTSGSRTGSSTRRAARSSVLRPPLTFSDTPARIRQRAAGRRRAHARGAGRAGLRRGIEIDDLHASGAVGVHQREQG